MATQNYGKNVAVEIKGDKIIITIDSTKEFGRSKSGKTIPIATTQGNVKLPNDQVLGINLYKYPEEEE